jgi:quinol monooxygenase YgiN
VSELHIVAVVHAKPGHEDALRAALTAVVAPSRNEEGNLRYELLQDQDDPRRFVFVEQWSDADLQKKHHFEGKHIQEFQARGAGFVEKIEVYRLDRIA